MSMQSRATTDSSVALSLADLAKIEDERVEREQADHARARRERAREEQEQATKRRAADQASAVARAKEDAERARAALEDKVRAEARERAAAEVLRIEAEAKARLELDNAVRAHELAVLRAQRETGRRRRELVLSALLALAVGLGGLGAYAGAERVAKLERGAEELRERERASLRERDDAKRTELSALERRYDALVARPRTQGAAKAFETAEAAHRGIDARSPGRDQLRSYAEALDALQKRLDTLDELAALQHRHADLAAWASASRRSDALAQVERAAVRAKAPDASQDALSEYARALDGLRQTLADRAGSARRSDGTDTKTTAGSCREGDPGCGLDGKPLF